MSELAYCGYEFSDSYELFEESDDVEVECGKEFTAVRDFVVTYFVFKKEGL